MFYEGLGVLLTRGADALTASNPQTVTERDQRQQRMLTSLMRRAGAVLPIMFAALQDELEVLEATRAELHDQLRELGAESPADVIEWDPDPLRRLRGLRGRIDQGAQVLHLLDHTDPAVSAARRRLRSNLAQAAAIEGRLVDVMLAT